MTLPLLQMVIVHAALFLLLAGVLAAPPPTSPDDKFQPRPASIYSSIEAPDGSRKGFFFRGDARPTSEIFRDGFASQGYDMSLENHLSFRPDSGFVSVTRSLATAEAYAFGRSGPETSMVGKDSEKDLHHKDSQNGIDQKHSRTSIGRETPRMSISRDSSWTSVDRKESQRSVGHVYVLSPDRILDGHWVPGIYPKDAAVQRNQEFAVAGKIPGSAIAGAYHLERQGDAIVVVDWSTNRQYRGKTKWRNEFTKTIKLCKTKVCRWLKGLPGASSSSSRGETSTDDEFANSLSSDWDSEDSNPSRYQNGPIASFPNEGIGSWTGSERPSAESASSLPDDEEPPLNNGRMLLEISGIDGPEPPVNARKKLQKGQSFHPAGEDKTPANDRKKPQSSSASSIDDEKEPPENDRKKAQSSSGSSADDDDGEPPDNDRKKPPRSSASFTDDQEEPADNGRKKPHSSSPSSMDDEKEPPDNDRKKAQSSSGSSADDDDEKEPPDNDRKKAQSSSASFTDDQEEPADNGRKKPHSSSPSSMDDEKEPPDNDRKKAQSSSASFTDDQEEPQANERKEPHSSSGSSTDGDENSPAHDRKKPQVNSELEMETDMPQIISRKKLQPHSSSAIDDDEPPANSNKKAPSGSSSAINAQDEPLVNTSPASQPGSPLKRPHAPPSDPGNYEPPPSPRKRPLLRPKSASKSNSPRRWKSLSGSRAASLGSSPRRNTPLPESSFNSE